MATREQRRAYLDASGGVLPRRDRKATPWLVAPVVGPLIDRLSRGKLGWCNATECALRVMAWVDTGHLYGKRSISRWILREWRAKRLRHKPIPAGARFGKTGYWSRNGTQLNRWPQEGERRERLWRARIDRRKARQAKARDGQKKKQDKAERQRHRRQIDRERQSAEQLATVARDLVSFDDVRAGTAQVLAQLSAAAQAAARPEQAARDRAQAEIERARAWAQANGVEWDPSPTEWPSDRAPPDRDDGA